MCVSCACGKKEVCFMFVGRKRRVSCDCGNRVVEINKKKRRKKMAQFSYEEDERLARQLQEEENKLQREESERRLRNQQSQSQQSPLHQQQSIR